MVETIEISEAGVGELLMRVRTASAIPVDNKARASEFPVLREEYLHYMLGLDFADLVERTGTNGANWKQGDDV